MFPFLPIKAGFVGVIPSYCILNHSRNMRFPSSLQSQRQVTDLYEDLRDGHNLISLLEVLSGETLVSTAIDLGLEQ